MGGSLRRWTGALLAREALRPYTSRWLYFGLLRKPRPSYLTDCWAYPTSEFLPSLDSKELFPKTAVEPDVLFLPMTDWHTRIQRTQHLALGLAASGHRCYYVNPHLGFQFRRVCFREPGPRLSTLAPGVVELHVRLPREPVVHQRLATEGECRVLAEVFGRLVRAAGVGRLVQIVSLPFWLGAAVRLKQDHGFPIVYDCHDLLSGFRGIRRPVVEGEADLFRHCDLAVFSSQPLMDAKTAEFPLLCGKSMLLRNAAAAPGALRGGTAGLARPGSRAGKVIGYVGALDEWFDVAALRAAARRRPEWDFVLIGRVESQPVLSLGELPNVKLVGEVPHSQLGAHLAGFDVGLIPFLLNGLTIAANPIKLYEYLSLGLPVVSTRLPEVERFGDLVYIAGGPEDFASKVEAAARQDAPALRQRRVAAVLQETWPSRVRQLREALGRLVVRPPARPLGGVNRANRDTM